MIWKFCLTIGALCDEKDNQLMGEINRKRTEIVDSQVNASIN